MMARRSKIEWCDYTWNPVTGCRHGCSYCYARKIARRFSGDTRLNMTAMDKYSTVPAADGKGELYVLHSSMISDEGKVMYPFGFEPTLHRYKIELPGEIKKGSNVFVGSMADVFGRWVPDEWIREIFDVCEKVPRHNYLFLTKNPDRYIDLAKKGLLPEQHWYGYTATKQSDLWTFQHADECPVRNLFVSIEPMLEPMKPGFCSHCPTDWVIIGAETGNRRDKVIPKREWIEEIVTECEYSGIPIFMKDSLIPIIGEENIRREFPEQLRKKQRIKREDNEDHNVVSQ